SPRARRSATPRRSPTPRWWLASRISTGRRSSGSGYQDRAVNSPRPVPSHVAPRFSFRIFRLGATLAPALLAAVAAALCLFGLLWLVLRRNNEHCRSRSRRSTSEKFGRQQGRGTTGHHRLVGRHGLRVVRLLPVRHPRPLLRLALLPARPPVRRAPRRARRLRRRLPRAALRRHHLRPSGGPRRPEVHLP